MTIKRHRNAKPLVAGQGRRRPARRRRHGSLLYLIEAIVCFAALGGIGYAVSDYVIASPHFHAKTVLIDGANVLREETILAAAGITSADNVLLLDREGPQQRVESLPYVKHCEVLRAYPDTIIIRVEERKPVATLLIHNRSFELDANAIILRELPELSTHVGPLITNVPELDVVEPGEKLGQPHLLSALLLWEFFSTSELGKALTVSEISMSEMNVLEMYCEETPFAIRFGESNLSDQVTRLNLLWYNKEGILGCKQYLDMRFGQSIVCK